MPDFMAMLLVALLLGTVAIVTVRALRRDRRARALIAQLEAESDAQFVHHPYADKYQLVQVNGGRSAWKPYVIAVWDDQLAIYDVTPDTPRRFVLYAEDLRWFGRPKKYTPGTNEIWLHAAADQTWWLLRLRMGRDKMQALVRELKALATPDQVTAYRRRRPYIHGGPLRARPAQQDMLGAWRLDDAVSLYLMPLFLVVLRGTTVEHAIPLEQIQNVSAIKRLDRPRAAGLVRFEVEGEPVAFALRHYRTFAGALAEAARRTLEDPVRWERKKKKPAMLAAGDELDEDQYADDLDDVVYAAFDGENGDGHAPYDDAARSSRING